MKKTLTYYLVVLFSLLTTTTAVNAEAVKNADSEKLNSIVAEMLDKMDRQAYLNVIDLITQATQYDMEAVGDEALPKLLAIKSAIEGTPNYRMLFHGKLLTGHFVVKNMAWEKEANANDLQFSFADEKGKPCVIKIATSAEVKKTTLRINNDDASDDDDSELESRMAAVSSISKILNALFEDVTELIFQVPAKTTIDVERDGLQLMHTSIDVDLDKLPEDLSEGMYLDAKMAFLKDDQTNFFELNLTNTGYKAGDGINFDLAMTNAGDSLLSIKLNAPGTFKGTDMRAYLTEDGGIDLGFESVNLDIDILGKAQLKGVVDNISTFYTNLMILDNTTEEESFKEVLSELNKGMDLSLFYDKSTTPAATFELVGEHDEERNSWDTEAVIRFASDNSTCTLSEFFTEENFSDVIEGMMTMVAEVKDVVAKAREKVKEIALGIKGNNELPKQAKDWYMLDGRRTNDAAKGLKIVRMGDGSVRKTMTK
jgi:hypothetical protein